jgi:hypothetical protein
MSKNAITVLYNERDKLIAEKEAAMLRFNAEIEEIEAAIAKLSGYKHHDQDLDPLYDDTHPDYIKASIEE